MDEKLPEFHMQASPGALLRLLEAVSAVFIEAHPVVEGDGDVRLAAACLAQQLTEQMSPSYPVSYRRALREHHQLLDIVGKRCPR